MLVPWIAGVYVHTYTHIHTHVHTHSTVPLKKDSSVEIRIVDDAFIKICDMVNDISMSVRALAAGLLGDFQTVSTKFLEQTLDKKLMSHLKVVYYYVTEYTDLSMGKWSPFQYCYYDVPIIRINRLPSGQT